MVVQGILVEAGAEGESTIVIWERLLNRRRANSRRDPAAAEQVALRQGFERFLTAATIGLLHPPFRQTGGG